MREMKDSGVEWIGEIPKDKKVLRNKYMFSYEKGKLPSSTNMDKKGFAYIGASDLDSNKSEYTTYTEDVTLPNAEYNDLLVLWDGARAGLCGTHKIGKLSSTIVRIKADKTVYQPFLYWYYKGFESHMYQSVNGTTIPHMNRKYIENIGFIDWTIQEQQKLSAYLDTKCTKIDSIIEKQEKVIEKLKEYKLSVITEAVTKGLKPEVKMKDSGVEWIGDIPEHWDTTTISRVAKLYNGDRSSNYPSGNDIMDEGVLFVTSNNLGNIEIDTNISTNKFITQEKYDSLRGAKLKINDIVFCLRGSVGKCGINYKYESGTIASSLVCIRAELINPSYLNYMLHTTMVIEQAKLGAIGIGSQNLAAEDIGKVIISIPTIKEQQQIADYLDKKCSAIDKSIEQKQAIIEKLKEYKKSLIYEVVTGKREV